METSGTGRGSTLTHTVKTNPFDGFLVSAQDQTLYTQSGQAQGETQPMWPTWYCPAMFSKIPLDIFHFSGNVFSENSDDSFVLRVLAPVLNFLALNGKCLCLVKRAAGTA